MNSSQPISPVAKAATPSTVSPAVASEKQFDPVAFFAALGDPVRWRALTMAVGGQDITVNQVASAMGRKYGMTHRHMTQLWTTGVLAYRVGTGGREGLYYVPAEKRPAPGVVDYGFCRLRLPGVAAAAAASAALTVAATVESAPGSLAPDLMQAPADAPPHFVVDAYGNRVAVLLDLQAYEQLRAAAGRAGGVRG